MFCIYKEYNALGRRIAKTDGDTTTYFYYDTNQQVIAEYEGISVPQIKREFVYGNSFNEILGMFLPQYDVGQEDWEQFLAFCAAWLSVTGDGNYDDNLDLVNDNKIDFKDFAVFAAQWGPFPSNTESHFYYLTDALGSVRGLIGGKFNREEDREFYNYDVYGTPSDSSAIGNPFMFAGYRIDPESGWYYLINRYYDPVTGRFLQLDPIGYVDSMNLYEYVLSSPISKKDPFGLYELEWEKKWSQQEKKRVTDSMQRIKSRSEELDRQIDNELKNLPQDKCYDKIRKELANLKKVLDGLKKGIASNSENLELYQEDFGTDSDAYARAIMYMVLLDNEVHLNTRPSYNWHDSSDDSLDDTLFHELSHLYGTEDDDSRGEYMNAHVIDDFMGNDISKNIYLKWWMMQCKKACNKENNSNNTKEPNNAN